MDSIVGQRVQFGLRHRLDLDLAVLRQLDDVAQFFSAQSVLDEQFVDVAIGA
ncbi:hypothetical protein D3C74_478840 [compost metagenome]